MQQAISTVFFAQQGIAHFAAVPPFFAGVGEKGGHGGPLARRGIAATIRTSDRSILTRRAALRAIALVYALVPRTVAFEGHNGRVERRRFLERRIRVLLTGFALGIVLAGVTAVPLVQELTLLARWTGAQTGAAGLSGWIARVRDALVDTDARYPFLAYGNDWLAFGHLMIAAAFWGPIRDPVRNAFIVRWGMFCCLASIPVALVFGPLRGVPLFWLPIDCAFGLVGIVPLWVVARDIRELAAMGASPV